MAKLSDLTTITTDTTLTNTGVAKSPSTDLYTNDVQQQVNNTSQAYNYGSFDYQSDFDRLRTPGGPDDNEGPGGIVGVGLETLNFTGNLIGGVVDSAFFGIPGLIDDLTGLGDMQVPLFGRDWNLGFREWTSFGAYDKWEDESRAGKWGRGIGIGLGMVNPFKLAGKALTYGGSKFLASSPGRGLWTHTAKESAKGFMGKYAAKEGGEQIIGAINKLGGLADDAGEAAVKAAFTKGYTSLLDDAASVLRDPVYKGINKGSQQALTEGVETMAAGIMSKAPQMNSVMARELSQHLITEAMHHSQNSLHIITNALGRGLLQGSDRVMFKVPTRLAPYMGAQGSEVYASQVIGSMFSDFAIGMTMHSAEAALHNLTYGGLKMVGATDHTKKQGVDQRSTSYNNLNTSFEEIMKHTYTSAKWMSLIGPTRFIANIGGAPINYGGKGLKGELQAGFKAISSAWKNTAKMSGKEARFHLEIIDGAADGLLHQSVKELANKQIANLSDDLAKQYLNVARKDFTKRYSWWLMNEAGEDIIKSTPRMISGMLAMNAHSIYDQFQRDPENMKYAFGEDGDRIVENIVIGMVFSKNPRSFKTGHKSRIFNTGDLRNYYSANANDMMKMRRGLELMGMDVSKMGLGQGNPVFESNRGHVINHPFFRDINDLVKDYYVDRVDHAAVDRKPAKQAFFEYIEKVKNLSPTNKKTAAEYAIEKRKWEIFENIINSFDNYAVDVNQMFRTVHGKEIYETVTSMNNLQAVSESSSISRTVRNSLLEAWDTANRDYKDIKKNYIISAYDALGIDVGIDSRGLLTVPRVDISSKYYEGQSVVKKSLGYTAVKNFTELIRQGEADGWLRVESAQQPARSSNALEGFLKSYNQAREAMMVHVWGPENVKNGHYPGGGTDGDMLLLINKGMREASLSIEQAVQVQNIMSLLTSEGVVRHEVFNTLDPTQREKVMHVLRKMRLDQNPDLTIPADTDPTTKENTAATEVFYKVLDTYRLLNQKGGSDKVDISLAEAHALRDALRETVGDVFESRGNDAYRALQNATLEHFKDQLTLNNANNTNSVVLATEHLIRGHHFYETYSGTNVEGVGRRAGNFIIRGPNGILMPDAKVLMDVLKADAPDKVNSLLGEAGIESFYNNLQGTIESSGNLVRFTKNLRDVEGIVKTFGPDKVIELLGEAKNMSDLGNIKDIMRSSIPLEHMASELKTVADNWMKKVEMQAPTKENETFFDEIAKLSEHTMGLNKKIQAAMFNHDYSTLANLNARKAQFDTYMGQINSLLQVDISKAGAPDLQYKKNLSKLLLDVTNFMSRDYGEINSGNYGKYVQDQLKEHRMSMPEMAHESLTNITASQFEGRYGFTPLKVAQTIKPHIDKYKETLDINNLSKAYDALRTKVVKKQSSIDKEKRRSVEDINIDVFQTVAQAVSMKKVNKLKWNNGKFELTTDYMLDQDKVGPLALMKNLGLTDHFYTLDKQMIYMDSKRRLIKTSAPTPEEYAMMGSIIGSRDIYIDNLRAKTDAMKGILNPEKVTAGSLGREYLHIALGEGNNIILPKIEARQAVIRAFGEKGYYREKLLSLFDNPSDKRIVDILDKYSNEVRLTPEAVENAILTARLIQDMPHLIVNNVDNITSIKDTWKRLKHPVLTKGRVYTDNLLNFTQNFYMTNAKSTPFYADVAAAFQHFKDSNGAWRRMRFIGLEDGAPESVLNSMARLERFLKANENIIDPLQAAEIINSHKNKAKSGVDAATYVTKEAFLIHLAQLGVRKDHIQVDGNGHITGFNSGAIKPKGVHVETTVNGGLTVFYDKTAIFYDAQVDGLLKQKGIDGLVFSSGAKINKHRNNNKETIRDRFIQSKKGPNEIGETMFDDISRIVMNTSTADAFELPLSTFNVTNFSREHQAKLGSNMAVHMDHNTSGSSWMQMGSRIQSFENFLFKAMNSDYSMTTLARDLLGRKNESGDLMLSKIPIEAILHENGLVIDQWMGDVVADKLFTYFFEGSKIATGNVGNSSITPMSPPIHHKLSVNDLAIRTTENVVNDGRSIPISRQKIIGDTTVDSFVLNQQFSFLGERSGADGIFNTPVDGGFFVKRLAYKVGEGERTADFMIIPDAPKKDGSVSWKIIGDGYEIKPNEVIDLNNTNREGVASRFKSDNSKLINDLTIEMSKVYNDLKELRKPKDALSTESLTNEQVVNYLLNNTDGMYLGALNNRQPRNLVNDVVVNKVTLQGGDKRAGNKSQQNLLDAIEIQDSDYDYDKSSTYLSAPTKFLSDVGKKAGYKMFDDSYSFTEKFFAELHTNLQDNSTLKTHLSVYENSAQLRGRIVKMHNVMTYFLNAFQGDVGRRTVGRFSDQNDNYTIRMKAGSEYFLASDNVSQWAKIFIDNYAKPTNIMDISPLLSDILYGRAVDPKSGKRHYEGLFEIVNERTGEITPYIDNQFMEIRGLLDKRIIRPINKYLRLNRGMTESQQGQTSSLKLKDIAAGFNTLNYELNNPNLYLDQTSGGNRKWVVNSQRGRVQLGVDLRPGMETLTNFITGGKVGRDHPDASRNPFDVAMRTLTQVYENTYHGLHKQRNVSEIESIMMKAEAGVLLDSEGIPKNWDRAQLTNALFKYVQNDYGYIEASKLAYRIESLKKDLDYMTNNKWHDKHEALELRKKITELGGIKADLEIMIGYDYEYKNGKPTTISGMEFSRGSWRNQGPPMVFWHTKGKRAGTIAGIVQPGRENAFDIRKDMVAMVNGKRFVLANPKIQDNLTAKSIAFSSLPSQGLPGQAITSTLPTSAINNYVMPVYTDLQSTVRKLTQQYRPTNGRPPGMTDLEFSTARKSAINQALNRLDNPLERKALLWMMLKPELMDQGNAIAYRVTNDGKHINEIAYKENPLSKAAWQTLLDINSQESFVHTPDGSKNKITKLEASNLIKEIVERQTLASLGIQNPYLEVNISYDFGDYRGRYHRELYAQLNRDRLHTAVKNKGIPAELALERLNEFMNGERLVTTAEMVFLEKKYDVSEGLILQTHATNNSIPKRPYRDFGRPMGESPRDFVNRLNREGKEYRKNHCKK